MGQRSTDHEAKYSAGLDGLHPEEQSHTMGISSTVQTGAYKNLPPTPDVPSVPLPADYSGALTLPTARRPQTSTPSGTPNVIIFGETGTGKSSLINMLSGREDAAVSNQATGGTFSSQPHEVRLQDRTYNIWDTAGLNEGEHGSVPANVAMENLRTLVGKMDEGVNLLVYCVRGARFREILKFNYDMFYKVICEEEVPIVIVVTGLEHESPMDAWWVENCEEFDKYGLEFNGCACITTVRGKNGMFEEEFEESTKKVGELIVAKCMKDPWKAQGDAWWNGIIQRMDEYQRRYNRRLDGPAPQPLIRRDTVAGGASLYDVVMDLKQCVQTVGRWLQVLFR
ncbi:hypothetical protein NLJ89_g9662 [Agrocybe chaxingu]|uniref:G domain-containing protein n=1 Tax=Agrocybe chaxingu TaxID=84603 RepID=A0A9W8JS10_9AGAR|nr:hypothetical protein NLJ89_g9662 [Agrocybe chaxingu]